MNLLSRRQSGASRLEIGFIAVIATTVLLLAYIKYTEISTASKTSVEEGLIEVIRNGIHDYAVDSKKAGSSVLYPPFLDEAQLGAATPKNVLFTLVTGKRIIIGSGIVVDGWAKTATNQYTAPSGKKYLYTPETGVFNLSGADDGK
ncbi:MAG: hypothetical protein GY753_05645 [Gammaproteobacteria bacterium]|nr:hypothetical protein [Gammaproteobacteria bacterium]